MKLGCDVGVTEGEIDGKKDGTDVGGVDGCKKGGQMLVHSVIDICSKTNKKHSALLNRLYCKHSHYTSRFFPESVIILYSSYPLVFRHVCLLSVRTDLVYPRMVGLFVASFSFGPSLWRSSSSAK